MRARTSLTEPQTATTVALALVMIQMMYSCINVVVAELKGHVRCRGGFLCKVSATNEHDLISAFWYPLDLNLIHNKELSILYLYQATVV